RPTAAAQATTRLARPASTAVAEPPVQKEPVQPDAHTPPPAAKLQPSFDNWLQDMEQAKAQAAREKKDIFLLFDGSDWCGWSIRFAYEVLFRTEFLKEVAKSYVLVLIDFPQKEAARAKVQDPARNHRLQQYYQVEGYPTVILTDAQGRPY